MDYAPVVGRLREGPHGADTRDARCRHLPVALLQMQGPAHGCSRGGGGCAGERTSPGERNAKPQEQNARSGS
jgi:hypothetical protein